MSCCCANSFLPLLGEAVVRRRGGAREGTHPLQHLPSVPVNSEVPNEAGLFFFFLYFLGLG